MGGNVDIDMHDGHMRLSCSNWSLCLDRMLTSEQITLLHSLDPTGVWDAKGAEISMPRVTFFIKEIADGIEVLHWEHKPIYVKVISVAKGEKIYEITGASSFNEASGFARKTWHEQFPYGEQAAVLTTKVATKKDMRKSVEIKEDS
jgi:hypothetical protein